MTLFWSVLENLVNGSGVASVARDHSALRVGNQCVGRADDRGHADARESVLPRLEEFDTLYSRITPLR